MSDASRPDPAAAYENLRRESAALLGLDPGGNLTALQAMQIDLASIIRMEIDAAQGAQLAGHEVDIGRLSVALGMLTKLLPQKSLEAETKLGFDGAREELARFLTARAEAIAAAKEREAAVEEHEVDRLRDEVAQLRGEPRSGVTASPAPARVTYLDNAVVDDPSPPAPLTPAQSAERIEKIMTRPRNEEWRNSYGAPFGIHSIPRNF
jgi:hypothetical protein